MSQVLIAGFDPGLTGGAALILGGGGKPVTLMSTYEFRTISGPGKRRLLDVSAIADWILEMPPDIAIIEKVGAMPKQGLSSTFTFGAATGALEAIVVRSAYSTAGPKTVEWVSPAKWKAKMNVTSDKRGARDRATMLFGKAVADEHWPLARQTGVAEAALMARWYAEERL